MIIKNFATRYIKGDMRVVLTKYAANGATAILLRDAETDEPLAVATVNVPPHSTATHVLVKSYSENEGMEQALIAAGVVGPRLELIPAGYTTVTKHELLMKQPDVTHIDQSEGEE
jgi:hypothetical protein